MTRWSSSEKRTDPPEPVKLSLVCQINSAQDIDEPSSHPELGSSNRKYRVKLWVDPTDLHYTDFVRGWTNPKWGQNVSLPVNPGSPGFTGELSFELERVLLEDGSSRDAATTSKWTAVVGRARVPLPELGKKKRKKDGIVTVDLVRPDGGECRPQGVLFYGMKLLKND